ncbi:alpha/beta fold hydrolase [Alicyclobacillus dauci]|uniref:Alpha/beta hydrolase n=1 Tax=Alicyclobacillus dauci TaxID=1475485 RepID=A0ABY6Z3M4_9BACL|nr:alpha/beta hydrolase [Alicyclobacillus dauci]WAH37470.1 alpha/beta hydrolase [Alicyclobacillus dauci]
MSKVKVYRDIAELGSVDLFFMDTQTDETPIICLHGRCGRAETWYGFMQRYGNKYRIIAPDQRGHGLSSRPESDYTDREMADDIIELMNYLDIKSAILVGHSMGGAVVGYLAALYPQYVKAAVVLDKSAAGPTAPLPIEACQRNDPTRDWPLPFPSRKDAMSFLKEISCSDLEYQFFMNSLIETSKGYEMMFSSRAIAIGIGHYVSWYHLLPKIKCPVLLIRSKSHEAVPDDDFEKMQSLIDGCISHEMSHPDHNVHLANEEEFYTCMDAFLDKVMSLPVI